MRMAATFFLALLSLGLASATTLIEDFEHGLGQWTSTSSLGLSDWGNGSHSMMVTNYDRIGWYVQLYEKGRTYEAAGKLGFWMYIASDSRAKVQCSVYYDDLSFDLIYAEPMVWAPDSWIFFECDKAEKPISILRVGMSGDATGVFYIDDIGFYDGAAPGVTGFAVTGVNINIFPVVLIILAAALLLFLAANRMRQKK